MGLSHSNLGQLKCIRSPGILGAISAIIIEYITSVYTPLRNHRVRTICSSPGIMYMRSFAPFGYICSMKSPQFVKYNIHVNTHFELVNMDIRLIYNAFENTIYITMLLSCKIVDGSIKSVICNVNIVFNF